MKKIDKPFIISVLLLTISGFFIFSSASLGILTKNQNLFYSVAFNQFVFGLCLGTGALFLTSYIPYKFWKKTSDFKATTWVNGDFVIMIITSTRPFYAIEIHDKILANEQRQLFKGIWETLEDAQ